MKNISIIAVALFLNFSIAAQDFTLSGYMRDASTGEELLYASVSVDGSTQGVSTNLYGFYSLTLPAGSYDINYSYVGYATQTISIDLISDVTHNVELGIESATLQEIVIVSESEDDNITNNEISVVNIDVKDIKKIPVIFGEQDVLKTLQLQPGVSASSEGSSGFFVRGGDADQNLILLDEAPVYNASHLLGFFSVFNSDALKDVKLYKGGIPAQYGGRASSVMDVRMRNGNMKQWEGSGGIGLISSRLTVEGPIVKDKGSIIVSGRRTYADLVAAPFINDFENFSLYFYDLNFKANYKLNDNDRVYVSGYLGRDVLGTAAFGFDWGNRTVTARWNHIFSNKLFSNTSYIYSEYDYGFDVQSGGLDINLNRRSLTDFSLTMD